jgi:F-type H+-transporting ATPase subunit epsilon
MADALTVELVAADRMVWSGEATMVIAKTVDGDIGVLRGHAPVLSLLSESVVEITAEDGHTVFAVADGGFLSVANDRVSILSEHAELSTEVDVDEARALLEDAKAGHFREGDETERRIRMAEARIRVVERDSGSSS